MLALPLFLAGLITILLPCILPLIPVVVGASIAGRSKWRPFFVVLGMFLSFVGFTFLLQVLLNQFVELADDIRIGTYYILLLFGLGFLTENRMIQFIGAVAGAFFFREKGWLAVGIAAVFGIIAMEIGGRVATLLQQWGADVQMEVQKEFGGHAALTAFIIGLTLGLVWVPCAGPALGFALALVREKPGLEALTLLSAYGAGAALPLLIIGYGGQAAVKSVRMLTPYSGRIKQVSGAILILSALAFQFNWFLSLQTSYGDFGTQLEEKLFPQNQPSPLQSSSGSLSSASSNAMNLPALPKIAPAPEFAGLGPWHNSPPLTLKDLKGKIVLIDFWTYSCINCIRTLPYVQGYWDKYKDMNVVVLGVHTPEFVFEKDEKNVAAAIKEHGLTYPVAQDNDYGTWSAFDNQYWPAKYLIDGDGYIRYKHFGEGGYDETDRAIASLLAEKGMDVSKAVAGIKPVTEAGGRDRTQETYLGSRTWSSFGNGALIPSDAVTQYKAPTGEMKLDSYYLAGQWQLKNDEYEELQGSANPSLGAEGEIRMRFLGTEINLVLGLVDGAVPVQADVSVDGKPTKTITIDRHDLFNLFTGDYGEHDMILKIHGKGVQGYAFTFGS